MGFRYIAYLGGVRGLSVFEALCNSGAKPVALVQARESTELKEKAVAGGIDYFAGAPPRSPEHREFIARLLPELIVACGYNRILPKTVLDIPRLGAINCHGGQLPNYRGASVIPWQIINGETKGAAYILQMTENIDDGPILASETYEIGPTETAKHIVGRVNDIFTRLLPEVVEGYASGAPPAATPQPKGQIAQWTPRKPADGLIDWSSMTAEQVVNLVRALDAPYPGAFTYLPDSGRITVHAARKSEMAFKGVQGSYIGKRNGYPVMLAADQGVDLLRFSVQGKDRQAFPIKPGDDAAN